MLPLPLRPVVSIFEIVVYSILAFSITLLATKPFVQFLHRYQLGKQLRLTAVDGKSASVFLEHHAHKAGTPTMGGLLICFSVVITIILSRFLSYTGIIEHSLLQRGQVYLPLGTLLTFALIGGIDDYINIRGMGKNKGLTATTKTMLLLLGTSIPLYWFMARLGFSSVYIPFGEAIGIIGNQLQLGWLYAPFFYFVVIGTTNAVNVTDGLDGLAAGLLIIAFGAFGIIAYISDLFILTAFCGVVTGALAGFLWHNIPPALFFMGDVGSLALGGTLAIMAFMIDRALLLPLIGIIFVLEMSSVIIQLSSKKIRQKKIFLSAPIHHHFQAKGWPEASVTMRFWILGGLFAFLGILVGIYG